MRYFKGLKITVAETGYVGLSFAVLLAWYHQMTATDIIESKVDIEILTDVESKVFSRDL